MNRDHWAPSSPERTWQSVEPINWYEHTMGAALLPYLQLKVHSLVQPHDWRRICVVGDYNRECHVSDLEKNGKMFNWHRPTADVTGAELLVRCYPGQDYVRHYALILATYLGMKGRFRDNVFFQPPDDETCDAAVQRLVLDVSGDHAVILGWGVQHLAGATAEWTSGEGYAWTRAVVDGLSVLYLGFLHSIWGEVAGRVVARLAALGARRIVYVGKVGTLDPRIRPNTLLATGCESLVGGETVRWVNFFEGFAETQRDVVVGAHVTSQSTLLETRGWLEVHRTAYSFVDPEIGPMGKAARAAGISFGYLHIISNNLARRYREDLSNERESAVLQRRSVLLARVKDLIATRLDALASESAGPGLGQ